ncbi:MAG TPA: hypothetical protein P5107_04665 [Thermotogota bacterium]|nr:hypothetical protein [Thermotogota bacterium]
MAQNKPRDDEFFNCGEEHENLYVSKLYGSNSEKDHVFLEKNLIKYFIERKIFENNAKYNIS